MLADFTHIQAGVTTVSVVVVAACYVVGLIRGWNRPA